MSYKLLRIIAVLTVLAMALAAFGCSTPPEGNANVSANTNASAMANSNNAIALANANAGTTPGGTPTDSTAAANGPNAPFGTKEPDRYSMKMNVSLQGSANNKQGGAQMEIEFVRVDANRRWTLKVPSLNQEITYMEKPGLRYLIIPSRSQYVEVTPESLGVPLGSLLSPAAIMERLQARPHENLGTETINGRTATKYKFSGVANTGTSAGTAQAESLVYVDQETTLPLRIDLSALTSSGAMGRGIVETRDIHLNPDTTQFDVPAGYQKVTMEQLKQQVMGFIALVRAIAPYLGQDNGPVPIPNANRPAPAANANRH